MTLPDDMGAIKNKAESFASIELRQVKRIGSDSNYIVSMLLR